MSLCLSVHSKLSLGYGAKIFVPSSECQFPVCLPMGICTVDYAAVGVYVVPTNGKEPYYSKSASVTRTIISLRSARKIIPHRDSIPGPSCTSSSVYLDRGTSCIFIGVRDNLHVSQLLLPKPWLQKVSTVVSEPKTKQELKNVTIWNKSPPPPPKKNCLVSAELQRKRTASEEEGEQWSPCQMLTLRAKLCAHIQRSGWQ